MGESPDQPPIRSTASRTSRPAGQHAARAWRLNPRALAAILLVVLALVAVLVVRYRTTLDLGQPCGSIVSGPPATPTSAAVVHTDIACLAQAYARCSAASLTTTLNFGDGSTQATYVVVPGQGPHGTCGLVIQWSTIIGGFNHRTSGQLDCAALTRQGDVLTFHGCGHGDVMVPPGI